MRRLYRSQNDRVIAGVCGGIAEYGRMDSTVVRLLWALLTIFTGVILGTIAYIVAWIIIPERY